MAAGLKQKNRRNIIGERLKESRNFHTPPLTQDQLSGKVAVEGVQLDRVAIAKIETGIRCAFDFEVKALAAALSVDANWLLGSATAHCQRTSGSGGVRKCGR
jgi:hypothetical protein